MEQERRQLGFGRYRPFNHRKFQKVIVHSITGSFGKFLLTLKQMTKVRCNSQNTLKSDLKSK